MIRNKNESWFEQSSSLNWWRKNIVDTTGVFRTLSNIYDDLFVKTVNEWKLLTIFGKSSILDLLLDSEYASSTTGTYMFNGVVLVSLLLTLNIFYTLF